MRKLAVLIVLAALVLSGCTDWMDGSYVSVRPHVDQEYDSGTEMIEVTNYAELKAAVENLVSKGMEDGLISLNSFNEEDLEGSLSKVARYIKAAYPLGAFAVESVGYELGTSGDQPAAAFHIVYNRNLTQIRSMKRVSSMDDAMSALLTAADNYATDIVILVDNYSPLDFAQALQDHADAFPDRIMEVPQITVNTYPDASTNCVMEVSFNYQSNRDSLRVMQDRVKDVFSSARLYVSGDGEAEEKYTQLYAFLKERFDYQYDTSITPSYSLLCHGVGDSRAFAVVYAAMCHSAELECSVVFGTRNAEPWFWNMVCIDGVYRHIDLLGSTDFSPLTDDAMNGYVWDYSAYPACERIEIPVYVEPAAAETVPVELPQEEVTEPTESVEIPEQE